MIELLEAAALADPDAIAVLTHDSETSYAELLRRSHAVARWLGDGAVERFALVEPDAAAVIALLAGASLAGSEACQYPPVDGRDDIEPLTARLGHRILLSDRADLDDLGASGGPGASRVATSTSWSSTSTTLAPLVIPAERPHLVLATGTTGAARGVRHSWDRLLHGVSRVRPAPDERWLLAYGLHQFAGLQILLHVLAARATLVAPAPRRPREGLEAMRALGVTHASATPTYWRFLLAELRADGGPAPALRQVTLGGEAVPATVLTLIGETFPGARISQVYAASEFGSSGSVRDGRAGLSTGVLDRGDEADVDMQVRDGELWVRSRTGMLGYHGEPGIDPDAWRPTGDLVEVVADRIEFRGRISEIINVGGVKVHPLPVEERVNAVAGVEVARVWGRPNPLTGAIVAVEVVLAPGHDPAQVKAAIRAACEDLPAPARPRSISFVTELATRGAKILRRDVP